MSLKKQIQEDMKAAMRSRDRARLSCIRLIMAAIKQREVDERIELDDAQVTVVLEKMTKQRRESIEHYEKAGREDLRAVEQAELEIINGYLPEPLEPAAVEQLINQALAETGATSIRDMGKVMALLKQQARGRVDMTEISRLVKARLGA